MKALVTGATGFVGSNLTQRLVSLGWKVNVLVRDRKKISRIPNLEKINIFDGDLLDKKSIKRASNGVSIIFNCAAALPHHRLKDSGYVKANIDGLKNILEVSKGRKIRLVHLSTVGIYGPTTSLGADENSPLNPQDTYARTKVVGEELIRIYRDKYKLSAVIIRPTIAYGPGDTRPGFLNLFKLIKKGFFIPIGSGDNFFHTIYIGNLVDSLILAAVKKQALGNEFIIGDSEAPRMKDIIKSMFRVVKKKNPSFYIPNALAYMMGKVFDIGGEFGLPNVLSTQRVRFLTENKKYSVGKAKKILGYKPKIALKEGLQKTYEWYNENGYL